MWPGRVRNAGCVRGLFLNREKAAECKTLTLELKTHEAHKEQAHKVRSGPTIATRGPNPTSPCPAALVPFALNPVSAQIKRDMDNDRYRLDSLKNELRDLDEQARARAPLLPVAVSATDPFG
jgi:hypothetical protein